MARLRDANGSSRAAIFSRLWETNDGLLPRSFAHGILKLGFRQRDMARMHELAAKNQEGRISATELEELDNYIEAGDLMALLQSKARQTLQIKERTPSKHG